MRLRKALEGDVESIVKLKSQLRLPATASDMSCGGFLLGSSEEQYLFFIQHARVLVLEDCRTSALAGFAIGLPDETLRRTDLWQRRESIQWKRPIAQKFEEFRLSYVEQLAIFPQAAYKLYAAALGIALVKMLFERHDFAFATVVDKPVQNLAARSLLAWIGAQQMGLVEEDYPQVGRITSAVYCLDRATYRLRIEEPEGRLPIADRVLRTIETLS